MPKKEYLAALSAPGETLCNQALLLYVVVALIAVKHITNLRSQCWFKLADKVNDALVYIDTTDTETKEKITEELDTIKEINDGKDKPRQIIPKGAISREDENRETIKSL